ncbi:MAG TPA: carboxyl transferase domain-containing protein, partial [Candidatus Polarisedimenticolaceae bacterium]|nr:carboxyl transferase domain-containing protein [Candidatus Polarisedimenticolaceae bacterium]
MAKLTLDPIGSPRERALDETTYRAQRAHLEGLNAALRTKRDEVRAGWGPEYHARVEKKGKLTTWDRIERLKDEGTPVLSVGTLVNYGRVFGEERKSSPGAGVVTAFVRVEDRWVVVIANDNTVASGSWWPQTPEKIQRAQEIALRLRLPVVYLVDCSGLFLPEQSHTFPGREGAGAIFRMNALLSD